MSFIQAYHKLTTRQSIEHLKRYANISEEYQDTRLGATKVIKRFKTSDVRKKESKRQTLSVDVMDRYEKNTQMLRSWVDEGVSEDVLEYRQVRYDPFSNRIVYPIRDNGGNIVGVKGRTLCPDYKEKKIRKYTYFNGENGSSIGDIDFVFGYCDHLEDYLQQKEVILFEGEKSVMKMESWGFNNVGALLTSRLNDHQLRILIKLGVSVVFALDKDVDIYEDKNIKKLSKFCKVYYIDDREKILDQKDAPVDKGVEAWKTLYEKRKVYR